MNGRTFVVNIGWREYVGKLPDERRLVNTSATVELTIDIDGLARQLGEKAVNSKARKSRMAKGKIVAKVHSIQQVPV